MNKYSLAWNFGPLYNQNFTEWVEYSSKIKSRGKKTKSAIPCIVCGKKARTKKIDDRRYWRCVINQAGNNQGYLCGKKKCYTFLVMRLL